MVAGTNFAPATPHRPVLFPPPVQGENIPPCDCWFGSPVGI